MLEYEVALLKLEIARLNRIISVLIEQHEIIKQKTAPRKGKNRDIRVEAGFQNVERGNLSDNTPSGNVEYGNHSTKINSHHIENGNISDNIASTHIEKGNLMSEIQLRKVERGNLKAKIAAFTDEELSHLTYSDIPIPLAADLNVTGSVKAAVRLVSHRQIRQSFVDNACNVIIHFHNGGSGDYHLLRRMTGLSNDGLAKFIRSLKRKQLIQRTGWQKFAPGLKGKAGLVDGWISQLQFPD